MAAATKLASTAAALRPGDEILLDVAGETVPVVVDETGAYDRTTAGFKVMVWWTHPATVTSGAATFASTRLVPVVRFAR